nr:PREDICTED: ribonuclease H2 subunit C [Anolis carolinensis]|eukprot:XP_008122924.2 PREDICTED: ribonuclease H2 subunit C [Anolis carolinensis]
MRRDPGSGSPIGAEGARGGGARAGRGSGSGMAAAARLALSPSAEPPRAAVHSLPCRVLHDGDAAVCKYFSPAIRAHGHESSVSFRGRSLKGTSVSVPEGYVGLVLEKEAAPLLPSEEQELRVKSAFGSLTVWNLEQAPKGHGRDPDGAALATDRGRDPLGRARRRVRTTAEQWKRIFGTQHTQAQDSSSAPCCTR